MIRNYLIIFFLLIFAACTNNTVRDYTSLKQKALEIPPDFELTPPVVGEEEVEEAAPTGESAEDIQDIITQDSSTSVPSNADTSSLDEFIDNNFGNEDQNINNSTLPEDPLDEVIEDSLVESNELDDLTNELDDLTNELDDLTNDDSILDTTDNIGLSEEEFLEGISNTDEITTLPEEDQLKPEIIDETMYDDAPSFDENEDLNDLLNRVDDLLNSYSN